MLDKITSGVLGDTHETLLRINDLQAGVPKLLLRDISAL